MAKKVEKWEAEGRDEYFNTKRDAILSEEIDTLEEAMWSGFNPFAFSHERERSSRTAMRNRGETMEFAKRIIKAIEAIEERLGKEL